MGSGQSVGRAAGQRADGQRRRSEHPAATHTAAASRERQVSEPAGQKPSYSPIASCHQLQQKTCVGRCVWCVWMDGSPSRQWNTLLSRCLCAQPTPTDRKPYHSISVLPPTTTDYECAVAASSALTPVHLSIGDIMIATMQGVAECWGLVSSRPKNTINDAHCGTLRADEQKITRACPQVDWQVDWLRVGWVGGSPAFAERNAMSVPVLFHTRLHHHHFHLPSL